MNNPNVQVKVNGPQALSDALRNYGTVILKPNVQDNRNVLTQDMMSKRNTKYVIQWNYDLLGETITVPEGCMIEFNGGTITNGTIVGNNTILLYDKNIDEICTANREGTFIYNTTVADEEDITSETGQLKFKDKAYNPDAYSGLAKKILRKNIVDGVNTLTQNMINEANTIYVIKYDFTLAEDITIPANCVLEFDGGSVNNGIIYLNNNCDVCGKGKFGITDNAVYIYRDIQESITLELRSGFVVEGKHDVHISGISFEYDNTIEGSVQDANGVICYGLWSHPVRNVVIDHCRLLNCRVAFWNNTENSKVLYCDFEGSSEAVFANETCYDYEGRNREVAPQTNGWKCCKNNVFAFNNVKNTCITNPYALMWCSGVDGLDIVYNNFEVCSDLMYIYCSDGNVSLKDAYIAHNNIVLKNSNISKNAIYIIETNGISWPYPRESETNNIQDSSCIIEDNNIRCELQKQITVWSGWTAINCSFMDSVQICNNTIDGFMSSIMTYNVRSRMADETPIKLNLMKGCYKISGNIFKNYYRRPIIVADNPNSFIIEGNVFETAVQESYTYWERNMIDLLDKINVSIIGNTILDAGDFDLFKTKNGSTDTFIKGNIISKDNIDKNGSPFNGSYFIVEQECYVEYNSVESRGSLSKIRLVDGLRYIKGPLHVGQILQYNGLYTVTKEGVYYDSGDHSATLPAQSKGSNELIYSSIDKLLPGHIIKINGTDYKVLNIYTKADYGSYTNNTFNDVVQKQVILVDKPLADDISVETEVSAEVGVLVDSVGNPTDTVYQEKVTGVSGNFAGFDEEGNLADSGRNQ